MEDEGRLSFGLHKRSTGGYRQVAMWEIERLEKKIHSESGQTPEKGVQRLCSIHPRRWSKTQLNKALDNLT